MVEEPDCADCYEGQQVGQGRKREGEGRNQRRPEVSPLCWLCAESAGAIGCMRPTKQDALTAQPVPSVLQLFLLLPCQQLKAVQPLREHTFDVHLRRRRRGGERGT